MGQRTPTETLFGIVLAFVDRRTWSQADLARRLELGTEAVRKRLLELKAGGLPLEREVDHPHVYWSVPKNWFPGALLLKNDEVRDLVRLLGRAPRGSLRTRLLERVAPRLADLGDRRPPRDADAIGGAHVEDDVERLLATIEDSIEKKAALRMRYFTASRRNESWRFVSVHRLDVSARASFVATCHAAGKLRRFRVSNVLEARIADAEPHRPCAPDDLQRFDEESFGGFRREGPAVACAFVVRDDDAAWVAKNLPDDRIVASSVPAGTRFTITTSAVDLLARFVVGLGAAARVETPELATAVVTLARGALADVSADGRGRR